MCLHCMSLKGYSDRPLMLVTEDQINQVCIPMILTFYGVWIYLKFVQFLITFSMTKFSKKLQKDYAFVTCFALLYIYDVHNKAIEYT